MRLLGTLLTLLLAAVLLATGGRALIALVAHNMDVEIVDATLTLDGINLRVEVCNRAPIDVYISGVRIEVLGYDGVLLAQGYRAFDGGLGAGECTTVGAPIPLEEGIGGLAEVALAGGYLVIAVDFNLGPLNGVAVQRLEYEGLVRALTRGG